MTHQDKLVLPATYSDFFQDLLADGTFERLSQPNSLENLSPNHKALLKYGTQALKIGRPINKCLFVMFGKTGSGKSTTINNLFGDKNVCPTNSQTSETRVVTEYSRKLVVNAETPKIEGNITFLDVPGTLDVYNSNRASNFSRVKTYREEDENLCCRSLRSIPPAFRRVVRVRVYPNLVLLVTSTDSRIAGPDSDFQLTLKALAQLDLVDRENLNLIVVVTSAMGIPRKLYKQNTKIISRCAQDAVYSVLRIKSVPVIFIENLAEYHCAERVGDFYRLPDGELSHLNLMVAMNKIFENNQDLLGKLLCGWYFDSECPEKHNKIIIRTPEYVENAYELQRITSGLTTLGLIYPEDQQAIDIPAIPTYYFSTLGHGYCPITESFKQNNLLESSDFKEFQIGQSKYLIPKYLQPFSNGIETRCERLTFENREAYQRHKSAQYGFTAGFQFIVQTKPEGRWIEHVNGANCKAMMSLRQKTKIISLRVKNPEKYLLPFFVNILNSLPESLEDENVHEFQNFFNRYGTHLVASQSLGGEVLYDCKISSENFNENKGREIQNRVGGILQNAINGNFEATQDNVGVEMFGICEESLRIRGGKPPVDLVERIDEIKPEQLREWQSSITESVVELQDGFTLIPFYELMKSGSRANALKKATTLYLKDELPLREIIWRNEFARKMTSDAAQTETDWVFIATLITGFLAAAGMIVKMFLK